MKKRRLRLGEVQRSSWWSSFGIGVISSIVGGLVVYLLVKDSRVT